MSAVGQWLDSLALGQYARLFEDNRIELDILPDLTDPDLEKLGIPLGDRKRLLKAIATLSAAPTPPASQGPAQPTAPTVERREVTILFVDLSGYTRLTSTLGAEATHQAGAAILRARDGHRAKLLRHGRAPYRRRRHGGVRRSHRARQRSRARAACRPRHPRGHASAQRGGWPSAVGACGPRQRAGRGKPRGSGQRLLHGRRCGESGCAAGCPGPAGRDRPVERRPPHSSGSVHRPGGWRGDGQRLRSAGGRLARARPEAGRRAGAAHAADRTLGRAAPVPRPV